MLRQICLYKILGRRKNSDTHHAYMETDEGHCHFPTPMVAGEGDLGTHHAYMETDEDHFYSQSLWAGEEDRWGRKVVL